MIRVTRLNNTSFVVNAELIETIEATPDTVVTLTTERKYVVRETVDELIRRVVAYKRDCLAPVYQKADGLMGESQVGEGQSGASQVPGNQKAESQMGEAQETGNQKAQGLVADSQKAGSPMAESMVIAREQEGET